MKFALTDQAKERFPVRRLCGVLGVSASGYFAWKDRPACRRQRGDLVLLAHTRSPFALSNGTYGSPRMTREFQEHSASWGFAVGRRRTARRISRERHQVTPEAPVQTHHRQRAPLAGRTQHHQPGLCCRRPQPEVGRRYLVCVDAGGMALSGRCHRPVSAPRRWLGCR